MPRLSEANRIRRMLDLREEIRKESVLLEVKKKKLKKIEEDAIAMLLKKELRSMSLPEGGSISANPEVVAQVQEWDDVFKYIKRNNAFYLLYRRINNAPWREEVKSRRNKEVPGISPFTRYKLSLLKG